MKVENAFPNSCTGIYAKESIFTAAAKAAITAVPKLLTNPCIIRIPKFMTDCCTQVSVEKETISFRLQRWKPTTSFRRNLQDYITWIERRMEYIDQSPSMGLYW